MIMWSRANTGELARILGEGDCEMRLSVESSMGGGELWDAEKQGVRLVLNGVRDDVTLKLRGGAGHTD